MTPQPIVSSYLIQPRLASRHRQWWLAWKIRLSVIRRTQPAFIRRSLFVVASWCVLAGCSQYLLENSAMPNNTTVQAAQAAEQTNPGIISTPLTNTRLVSAHLLPSGPTGQLLPPGQLAPYGSFFSTYAKGQCTWYVASRRPIPSNWGNAVSWYYHATASGWKVGTVPAVGAIAWTSAGAYGHVALVEGVSADHRTVYIAEMNYQGVGVISHRNAPASSFRYIY